MTRPCLCGNPLTAEHECPNDNERNGVKLTNMADVEYGEMVERHAMVFSEVEVEVAVDGDGNAWVNLNRHGDTLTSFSFDNWDLIAEFVQRHATGSTA